MTRILIVDDHHHYRAQLRQLIESEADWEICGEAADGKEAIEKHSSIQPHVTVMDFNMPKLNGLDASRAICTQISRSSDFAADDLCFIATDYSGQEARNQRFLFESANRLHNSCN
jgi:DNA-binding NarL/FixJ family response regulator